MIQNFVIVSSFFVMIGFLTKIFLPLLLFTFFFLYEYYYLGVDAPVVWIYFWFPLIILLFSKCNHRLSIDSYLFRFETKETQIYRWPIELISLWIVYIYFSAGIAKIFPLSNFILYLNGETIRSILYNRYPDSSLFFFTNKVVFDLSSNDFLFSMLAISGIILEISTILIIFTDKLNYFFILFISIFHIFLFFSGVQGFLVTFLVLSISLLSNSLFENLDKYSRSFYR